LLLKFQKKFKQIIYLQNPQILSKLSPITHFRNLNTISNFIKVAPPQNSMSFSTSAELILKKT